MIVKEHVCNGRLILAACDDNLLGKKIEDTNTILDLSSEFYNGNKIEKDKFLLLVKRAYIINAVGEKTINILIKEKIFNRSDTLVVKTVPYIHIVYDAV